MNSRNVQLVNKCVPATAISVVRFQNFSFLLSGHGNDLQFRDVVSHKLIHSEPIFENQAIHGIRHRDGRLEHHCLAFEVLVWGGAFFCILDAKITTESQSDKSVNIIVVQRRHIHDWILDATSLSDSNHGFAILTAHNVLQKAERSARQVADISVDVLARGPFTFLYSGHVSCVSHDTLLVASGTVFGEVLLWTCRKFEGCATWEVISSSVFYGHKGSIFGVCISEPFVYQGISRRLLASCSDDRTIMLWDVSGSEQGALADSGHYHETEVTGFGENVTEKAYLAKTWGHISRIWGVHFVPNQTNRQSNIQWLISRGEDGVYQTWRIDNEALFSNSQSNAIQPFERDRHHSGKNIWSLSLDDSDSGIAVFSSGADGQIVSRTLGDGSAFEVSITFPFREMFVSLQIEQYEVQKISTFKTLKNYLILDGSNVLATTNTGTLLEGKFDEHTVCWRQIATSRNNSPFVLSTNSTDGYAFFIDPYDNSMYVYRPQMHQTQQLPAKLDAQVEKLQIAYYERLEEKGKFKFCLLVLARGVDNAQAHIIFWDAPHPGVMQVSLSLPETFVVTSCLYYYMYGLVILGSRSGALAMYGGLPDGDETAHPIHVERHVHGSETVTSITTLPLQGSCSKIYPSEQFFLTTGRDGSFAILRVTPAPGSILATSNTSIEIVHQGYPPIGSNIEGAVITANQDSAPSIMLYGFQSKDFVVWDESKQVKLLSIDCGGAHRSWNFHFNADSPPSATFIWTKAGHFHLRQRNLTTQQIIQPGGHGREIKALAVHYINERERIIATGAEDTNIRLFSYRSSDGGQPDTFKMLAVLRRHTTGLQCLRFSQCGNYLFSAAGMEELYMWKLYSIPGLRIGVKFIAEFTSGEEISDARTMFIDFIEQPTQQAVEFTVFAAYSNGKVKAVNKRICCHGDDPYIDLPAALIDFGALCLTQIILMHRIRLWERHTYAAIGATNGFLSVYDITGKGAGKSGFRGARQIHQSSIVTVRTSRIDQYRELVVTGGDDNALGLTIIEWDQLRPDRPSFRTLLVPNAHAAALTALVLVEKDFLYGQRRFHVATAGNDQRVKVWSVVISKVMDPIHDQAMEEEVKVDLIQEHWTSVADISGMEVVSRSGVPEIDRGRLNELLVVGVGMEVMRLEIPCSY